MDRSSGAYREPYPTSDTDIRKYIYTHEVIISLLRNQQMVTAGS